MNVMLCTKMKYVDAVRLVETSLGMAIEFKQDGVRAWIENGRMYDRRGVDITVKFPEFKGLAEIKEYVFDGEIVAQSGEFNDIAGRMHMKDAFAMKMASKHHPARFVVFDVLRICGMDLTNNPFERRREELRGIGFAAWPWMEHILSLDATPETFKNMWEKVLEDGKEGLVLKRLDSCYEGRRSLNWLKVKSWVEVKVEFTDYEVQPRGITLQTADGRRVVMNGEQAKEVIEAFKERGSVFCDIQYMEIPGSIAWRMPTFHGLVKNEE